MMVLVDTTVWIDFFADKSISHVTILETLIKQKEDICICGIILTEVLQGIKKDSEFKKTKDIFNALLFLPMNYNIFLRSAEMYRELRRKGITIRKSLDCVIASVAIENNIALLHNDKDFKHIGEHFSLNILKVNGKR